MVIGLNQGAEFLLHTFPCGTPRTSFIHGQSAMNALPGAILPVPSSGPPEGAVLERHHTRSGALHALHADTVVPA